MLFHIRDSSECANTNEPPNPPLYDNKAGRHRRSTKRQPLEVHGKTKCPNMESNYTETFQRTEPRLEEM